MKRMKRGGAVTLDPDGSASDKTQFDITWSGALSYRIPFGSDSPM